MKKKYDKEYEKKERLESKATKITQSLSGMPSGCGVSDKTAIATEIADCDTILSSIEQQEIAEYNRLTRYISGIDDVIVRDMIKYRFIELLSWDEVAIKIGGNNTKDTVKTAVYRYLKKH